jgi:hypothetical protein
VIGKLNLRFDHDGKNAILPTQRQNVGGAIPWALSARIPMNSRTLTRGAPQR